MDNLLNSVLIDSVRPQLRDKLDSGEYQCRNSGGRPYLTDSEGSVLCIHNGEFSVIRDQSFIDKAQNFYDLLPPVFKTLAQRKIMESNPQIAGASLPARCSGSTTPDSALLTQTQCQLLKAMVEEKGVFFNLEDRAITTLDESTCYRPDDLNGFTASKDIRPLANFAAIEKQYTQWAGVDAHGNATAVQSLPQPTSSCRPPLPPQPQKKDVKSIGAVIDYVTPGYHPLVIFDADDTLVARDVINGEAIVVAVEKDTAATLKRLKEKAPDAQIIVLTQATAKATREKLQKTGISEQLFDSIESVNDKIESGADKKATKGTVMQQYIRQMADRPEQVCFVDDMDVMLDDVEATCAKLQIHCTTFLYTGAEEHRDRVCANVLGVSVEEFKRQQKMMQSDSRP
ncbi:DUF2608 domain-containing protein [Endozoicomonas sp. ONNA2]|uniref:DUF2608 domain-containing protein n=1 Tax=Endozoicomonas sp. ONNA2 TaxID=2828741 RepID=UPI0021479629|nr:DUF2608 domain-containing protein [Endozoicomonas sp. ONNA2]